MRRIFRHICGAVFLGVLALGAVSCAIVPDPELILLKNTVSSRKGSQFLTVETPGAWTLSSDADWVQIIPDKGRGSSHSIALSYDANKEETGRKANIVLQAEGKEIVVTLKQDGYSPNDTPEFNGEPSTRKGWMELPETLEDDGLNFFWHNMNITGYSGRNYSFYWDYSNLVSRWVAYPLNTTLRGSGSRSEAWGYDPLLPSSKQPNITSAYRGGWARGHQLPSADRLTYAANVMTFYGTNMTPQEYNFNGGIWARLEESVRGEREVLQDEGYRRQVRHRSGGLLQGRSLLQQVAGFQRWIPRLRRVSGPQPSVRRDRQAEPFFRDVHPRPGKQAGYQLLREPAGRYRRIRRQCRGDGEPEYGQLVVVIKTYVP